MDTIPLIQRGTLAAGYNTAKYRLGLGHTGLDWRRTDHHDLANNHVDLCRGDRRLRARDERLLLIQTRR